MRPLFSRLLRSSSSPLLLRRSQTLNPKSPHLLLRPFSSSVPSDAELRKYAGYFVLLLGCGAATYYSFPFPADAKHKKAQIFRYAPLPDDLHTVSNWSGTHEVHTRVLLQPESLPDLEAAVRDAHANRRKIRPLGSGLSPNGIGLSRAGMVNLALMDKVLGVDREAKRVTVQAGIRVAQLVDALKEHGLTLQNFASIREQQIGGIIQVGAHGTGARLPPIDEQVVSMKLVTPAKGTIELSKEKDPELFYLARCGLGGLGVVAEVTLQCVDRHELVEHTFVTNAIEIRKNHKKWLAENKHIKYLWIPYTDTVVVVKCNPPFKGKIPKFTPKYGNDEALQHVRDLYCDSLKKYRTEVRSDELDINQLSFTELRDKLLALDPLNKDHVINVNQAEAEYWRKSEGYRVGWSDEILGLGLHRGFEAADRERGDTSTCTSRAALDGLQWQSHEPASSPNKDDIFSWVGIIMYLPTTDARQRKDITEEFFNYRRLTQTRLWDEYSAYEHWAKIEVPKDKEEFAELQARLRKRFPVDAYNKARRELDPNGILSNAKLEKLFPMMETLEYSK
uniref:FAD-binding PCMH-type domain-containing protein n=1 Tax=Ananas comosus var. bracteatus TaxID=296719 RepID=A0A6V7NFC4_ANACO|nr:unnamed protein product [Ananas comosus var. bracteatus]